MPYIKNSPRPGRLGRFNLARVFGNLLLDLFPGASFTFSLRKLKTDYAGAAARIRRSSGNSEQNIGFDSSGNFDITALTTFLNGSDGFLVTKFDNTASNNSTQTTLGMQPKIATSGIIEQWNNRATIRFDGVDDWLSHPNLSINGFSLFAVLFITSSLPNAYKGVFSSNTTYNTSGMTLLVNLEQNQKWGTYGGTAINYIDNNRPKNTTLQVNISYLLEMHCNSDNSNGKFYLNNVIDGNFLTSYGQTTAHIGGLNNSQKSAMQLSEIIFYPFNNEANRQ
ncbi:hypothetical protein BZZ01_05010 [Nostocales cyanobacterium HT-58-2]|nr:hypothetical protein BZZ01_05010 [Nostocales cyanobacterium HT-58-2]